jgi:hypothetical protein
MIWVPMKALMGILQRSPMLSTIVLWTNRQKTWIAVFASKEKRETRENTTQKTPFTFLPLWAFRRYPFLCHDKWERAYALSSCNANGHGNI